MNVASIIRVPRTPVVELEGMGEIARVGVDFDQAPWPQDRGVITLSQAFRDYIAEHVSNRGGDVGRTCLGVRSWLYALDPMRDAATMTRADGRAVVQYDIGRGCAPATARRNMAMGIAALNHARREERIKSVPKFQMPEQSHARVRWLTRPEHRQLILVPKPKRRQLFWLVAFATGARSEAIIEATWDRVDFAQRTIDFRVPGVVYRNKRRVVAPISDSLLPRLESAYARRTDNYVIGLGERGKPSCTWKGCKEDLKAIGIEERGVCRHVARHTVASWLLQGDPERGIKPEDIYYVAKLLGDTVAMVEKVYGHIQPEHLLRCANALPC